MERKTLQPHLDSARRASYFFFTALAVVVLSIIACAVAVFFAVDSAPILSVVSRGFLTIAGAVLIPVAILLGYLAETSLNKFSKELEKLYLGTRWISPDGYTGTVQAVSNFGETLDLAFPDGKAGEKDIQTLRPVGTNPGLLPEAHIASVSSDVVLEQLRCKDSRLIKTLIALFLVLTAAFIGAMTLIPGKGDGYAFARLLCVLLPLIALCAMSIKGIGIRELRTQTMVRKFSDAAWLAPDGRVGRFGLFSEETNEVTLVMEDKTLRQFNPDELVQA